MNRILGPVLATALTIGGLGGAAAYRGLADAPTRPAVTSEQTAPGGGDADAVRRPGQKRPVVVRWSRCRPPSRPRGHVCVLRVVRTVER